MPQDAFTLKRLSSELNTLFFGGKVNKIIQPNNDEVVFSVYNGKGIFRLFLDVNPASPKIGILDEEKEAPLTAPNFCMLLRKHLLSATIKDIKLIGFDRIIAITFIAQSEFSDATEKVLYVELMGRYSNIILTEKGKVLGGNRGVNFFDNGVRPLIVFKDYVLPPVNDKKLPTDTTLICDIENNLSLNIADFLCEKVQGLSTLTAREIEYLWNKNNGDILPKNCPKKFFDFLNDFLFNKVSKPCLLIKDNSVVDVFVFPYESVGGNLRFYDNLYTAEKEYFLDRDKAKKFATVKGKLISIVSTQLKKYSKKLSMLKARQSEANNLEENRVKGELLLSNIYRIKRGESSVILENYYDGNKPIKIDLDVALSVSDNAEKYYKKYTKQKRTLVALIPQLEQFCKEEEYLKNVLDEIEVCDSVVDLNAINNELIVCGLVKEQKGRKNKEETKPYREYEYCGYKIKVGRNNVENDMLTGKAKQEDMWLHAKLVHSSHVIIESKNVELPEKVIMFGAEVCGYYSKSKLDGKVEISYTQKKHVKKPPKSKPGFVTYDSFKTVVVKPDKHESYVIK